MANPSTSPMIARWANQLPERKKLTEFFTWLNEKHPNANLNDLHLENLLDEYHEIDRKQLDQERTAALDSLGN